MTDFKPHFDDDAWLNFVRDVLPALDAQEMRAHLDRSCVECHQSYQTWKRFLEIARRELPDVAADFAARCVSAAFKLRRKIPFREGAAVFAKRVFDSSRDPAPAGIRGSAVPGRQLLFEAGGYLIDLRLEPGKAGPGTLTGQVVHAWTEGASCGAGVFLVQNETVVGQAVANSLGEFQFDCENWENLKVCLGLSDETLIEVSIGHQDSLGEQNQGVGTTI